MRNFHRTQLQPDEVLAMADKFFPALDMQRTAAQTRSRVFSGPLGTLTLSVRKEGGHYTLIEFSTDQIGESRLDRNAKKFFVQVHRTADPRHALEASY